MQRWIQIIGCVLFPILAMGQADFLVEDVPRVPNPKQLLREQQMLFRLDSLMKRGTSSDTLIRLYNKLTRFYLNSAEHTTAEHYNEQVFSLRDLVEYPNLYAQALSYKGKILNAKGLFGAAMEAQLEELDVYQLQQDSLKVAEAYQEIGRSLRLQKQYDYALDYFFLAKDLREQVNKPSAKLLQVIGVMHTYLEEYETARPYLEKSIALAIENRQRKVRVNSIIELANLEYLEGAYEASLALLEGIQASGRRLSNAGRVGVLRTLARNKLALGDAKIAKKYSEEGYAISTQVGMVNWQIFLLDEVIRANKALGLNGESVRYLELQRSLKDSMFALENLRLSADYQALYETREKEKQVFEQQEVIAQQTSNRNKLVLGFSLFILLASGSFLFYRRQVKHQAELAAMNTAIQRQQIQELKQQQQILSMSAMIEGQEAERLRIAKDLHDGIGGLLTSVKAHFGAIETELQKIRDLNIYEKTNQLIDEACVEVRRISHNMVPHALSISGLGGALEDIAAQLERRGIQCDLETNEALQTLEEKRAVLIYRIIQELVNNIQKHADASQVLIQVLGIEDSIHILVEDDGKGFDTESPEARRGLGRKSIDSRVNYLDGTIEFDSVIQVGTTVSIRIPKSAEKSEEHDSKSH